MRFCINLQKILDTEGSPLYNLNSAKNTRTVV